MKHLSGLDSAFLYLETPETPMHVGGLNLVELPAGYRGDFHADVQRRVQVLLDVLGRELVAHRDATRALPHTVDPGAHRMQITIETLVRAPE